jgi:beta-lactam-binding protein with PASTA domain
VTRLAEGLVIDGRYKLIRKLGAGGMAEVWAADDDHLGRQVALKILHERFAQDREFVERFRREASSAAGLQHPNVVSVFDRGEFEDTYYIAMELLEGDSLKQLIAKGLDTPRALAIVRQILSAAQFAHGKGIVHRDLKPQNVIVSPQGKVTVTDFGIAHAGASEITQTGSVMGTAHYLSPEQAQGLPVTAASDLYSIGVILYECLTGHVPFEADSSVAVALKQVSEAPRRPSALNPRVSPALDAVVMRALAKDPKRRFASADAFVAAIDHAEANPGEPAPGDTAAFSLPPAAGGPPRAAPIDWGQGPPRRRLPGWRVWALAAVLLLAAAIGAYALTRPDQAIVPSVTGQQVQTATQILATAGFQVQTTTVQRQAPVNTVIEQDPLGGEKADKGATVTLSVSAGPGVATVPTVAGLSAKKATLKLEGLGFQVTPKQVFSKDFPAGAVVGTDPKEGVQLSRGLPVTLLISKGADQVSVPDVVGLTRDSARASLQDAKLVPEIAERDDPAPTGQVVEQDPAAGSLADKGSTVRIIVSTGHFAIPNVVGMTEQQARRALQKLKLVVQVERQQTDRIDRDGKVVSQAPPPGSGATRGDVVTITVAKFQPTFVP